MVEEQMMKRVRSVVFVLVGFIIFIIILNELIGGNLIKSIAAGIFFWIPFGALGIAFTQILSAIPG